MWLDALSSGEAAVQLPESQLEKLSVALDEWRASARSASRELRLSFRSNCQDLWIGVSCDLLITCDLLG